MISLECYNKMADYLVNQPFYSDDFIRSYEIIRSKLLAITLRIIAITITIMAKKLIDYCNNQYMRPKNIIAIMQ